MDVTRRHHRSAHHRKVDGRARSATSTPSTVHPHATKTQIRHAIEEIFKVNVIKVNTVNVRGKAQQLRAPRRERRPASRRDWKKAIVTLKPGQKIELGGVNYFEQ